MGMNYRYSGSVASCGFLEEFEKDKFKAQMREMIANEDDENNERD